MRPILMLGVVRNHLFKKLSNHFAVAVRPFHYFVDVLLRKRYVEYCNVQ